MDKDITSSTEKLHRTEEVQEIIERMPTRFGARITMIVAFIISLIILFGWKVRYPDVIWISKRNS